MPNKQHVYVPNTDLNDDRVAVQGSAPKHIISSIVSRCLDCNSVKSISNANDIAERALLNSIPQSGITCRGLYQGFGLTIAKMATAPFKICHRNKWKAKAISKLVCELRDNIIYKMR